ncbi:unnamed protein product [Brassica rapa subsp. trilocularis]
MRKDSSRREEASYTSPQYVKTRRHHPYESSHKRAPFPQRDMRQWRVRNRTPPEQQTRASPETEQQRTPESARRETNQNSQQRNLIPTTEEVMNELHEATNQYLS